MMVEEPTSCIRVAVIGAGPAGFYVAEQLARVPGLEVSIDLIDRLPTPFGLVRSGVAPDHEKIKRVTEAFHKTAMRPNVQFFGNVTLGEHLAVEQLRAHYHQVVYCTGAQTERSLGIPGEDLAGSHSATSFVGWYNGHPDYRDERFDLSHPRVAVVGMGNVALDVCRILVRDPHELEVTDIADHALEALRKSGVREVVMIGRRGPAQAAFTGSEVEELQSLAAADVRVVLPEGLDLSRAEDADADRATKKKLAALRALAARPRTDKPRLLTLRFLASPVELLAAEGGHVSGIRLVENQLVADADGSMRPRATDRFDELEVGLVLSSIGYRGVALPGVPFDERRAVVPSDGGRIVDPETGRPVPGQYVAGWIKRGSTGVIGTNKPDALETVTAMVEDVRAGLVAPPAHPTPEAAERMIRSAQPQCVSYGDWLRLDAVETSRGHAAGRPRSKLTRVEDMLAALDAHTHR